MRGEGEVRGDVRTVMVVAACALIALFGGEAFAEDETWYFGYEEPGCGGAPYLATRNLATIRREEARGALLSSSTVGRGDREHVDAILGGERSVSDAGPCRLARVKPDPIGDPAGPAADAAAIRAIVRAVLEEASAALAAHEADLRAAHAAVVGKAHLEAGAAQAARLDAVAARRDELRAEALARRERLQADPEEFVGYADNECEKQVEVTQDMAVIVKRTVARDVKSFTVNGGSCTKISPAEG